MSFWQPRSHQWCQAELCRGKPLPSVGLGLAHREHWPWSFGFLWTPLSLPHPLSGSRVGGWILGLDHKDPLPGPHGPHFIAAVVNPHP